jgi:hypothetical protein
MKTVRFVLAAFALGVILSQMTGCATDDPENVSSRPWNTPKSWENGLPSNMSEGR